MRTRPIALMIGFAAFYLVLSLLPGIPVIGLPQLSIELEASFASLAGAIGGPAYGFLGILIGSLLSLTYGGARIYLVPFAACPAFNALVTGLIFSSRVKLSIIALATPITLFWLTPVVQPLNENWYVGLAATFDKIIALALVLFLPKVLPKCNESRKSGIIGFLLVFFVGMQADASLGSLIFATPLIYQSIFSLSPETVRILFLINPLVYPVIRLLQALLAALIGFPVYKFLDRRGLKWVYPSIREH